MENCNYQLIIQINNLNKKKNERKKKRIFQKEFVPYDNDLSDKIIY